MNMILKGRDVYIKRLQRKKTQKNCKNKIAILNHK